MAADRSIRVRRECACATDTHIGAGYFCPRCGEKVIHNAEDVEALVASQAAMTGGQDSAPEGCIGGPHIRGSAPGSCSYCEGQP